MPPPSYSPLTQEAMGDSVASSPVPLHEPAKPQTYYGEGPFDAPSSEDENEALLDKRNPGDTEGATNELVDGRPGYFSSPLRILLLLLASLVVLSGLIGAYAAWTYRGLTFKTSRHELPLTMDHIFNGAFHPRRESLAWVPEGTWRGL